MESNIDKGGYTLAVEETGLPLGTLYSMVARQQIPHIRLGPRLVVFSRSELRKWLSANSVVCARMKTMAGVR